MQINSCSLICHFCGMRGPVVCGLWSYGLWFRPDAGTKPAAR